MDNITTLLAPVFAAGLAIQQLLEVITSFLDLDSRPGFQKYKKPILGLVALAVGFTLAANGYLRVLQPLFAVGTTTDPVTKIVTTIYSVQVPSYLDFIVTGLVISAGTEGINSILKFLKYTKEDKKRQAAAKDPAGRSPQALATDAQTPTPEALARISLQ
jgi:hypothetical protein